MSAETITITFNPADPEDCKRAVAEMKWTLWAHLGPARARQILSEATPSRQLIGANSNLQLMAFYLALRRTRPITVKQYAAIVAKGNATLPAADRRGPRGSTNPAAMEKQIRREKKRAAKDPDYRKLIASLAETYQKALADIPK